MTWYSNIRACEMNNNLRKTRMCTRATLINGIEKLLLYYS